MVVLVSICPIISGTGQKIKIQESLSYNIPVITFQVNNIDILNHKTNSFINETIEEFAESINYVFKNPKVVESMDCNNLPLELYKKSYNNLYNLIL